MSLLSLHVALITETFIPSLNDRANPLRHLSEGLRALGHRVELIRPRQGDETVPANGDVVLCHTGWRHLQWGQLLMYKLLRRWRRDRPDVLLMAADGPLGKSALRAARRLHITVVSGVDSQLFDPIRRSHLLRSSWGLDDDDLALIHSGRLAGDQNLGLLKLSLEGLRARFPLRRLKLIVIGDGPQRRSLQQQLPDAIFCGPQHGEVLATHYASADVLLLPDVRADLTEPFGNLVLQAQASGLAVVAYDQGAAVQHIHHGHTGAVALPGDEEGFIDAAGWLLEDEEALRRVRLNARHHATRQDWGGAIKHFESQLRSACDRTGAPP
ncbi:glycosyltransferase [Pseudomonas sp. dw_358]|uniref:glycosyltransferase n=1 Tax=Pseudomonas sp. dw_358 TaxID=2720083 RepID=UPI001BD40D80|nr:glycosyltransferase [Pseudomonas sp. dw_358]